MAAVPSVCVGFFLLARRLHEDAAAFFPEPHGCAHIEAGLFRESAWEADGEASTGLEDRSNDRFVLA